MNRKPKMKGLDPLPISGIRHMKRFIPFLSILLFVPALQAGDPKPFPEAKYGKGELRYVDGMPVLIVRGTPTEMGEQFGKLAIANAPDLTGLHEQFLNDSGQEKHYPGLILFAATAEAATSRRTSRPKWKPRPRPPAATSRCSCSPTPSPTSRAGWAARPSSSRRSGARPAPPLFGRNFDWLPTKGITEHTLVVVYKGEGKRAFAAVTITPIEGVISGMNDAGPVAHDQRDQHQKSQGQGGVQLEGHAALARVPPRAGGMRDGRRGREAASRHAADDHRAA